MGLGARSLVDRLLQGAALAFGLQIAGTGLSYLWHVLLARWTGAAEFGAFSYAYSWAHLAAVIAGLGLPVAVLRFVPEYRESGDAGRLKGLLWSSLLLTLGASVGLAAAAFLGLTIWAPQRFELRYLVVGLWLVPPLALVALGREALRGAQRIGLSYAPAFVLHPLLIIALAFLWLRAGNDLNGATAVGLVGVSLVVVFIVLLVAQGAVFGSERKAKARYDVGSWLRVALPLLIVQESLIILTQADIVMIGLFRSPEEVAYYTAATKTAILPRFVLTAVNALAAPMIAGLWARGEMKDLQRLVTIATRWMFWPAAALTVLLVVFSGPILGLFGAEFSAGRTALCVLALGQFVNASMGPCGHLLSLTGHQGTSARLYAASAVVNIGLNAVAIPRYGIEGAAWATATTLVLWNVWAYVMVRRRVGVTTFIFGRMPTRG